MGVGGLGLTGKWIRVSARWLSRTRQPGVIVLMYHRVGGQASEEIDISTQRLESQLVYLLRRYRIVPLDDVVNTDLPLTASDPVDRVVLTFDDGYRETYDALLPLLHRYRIPVTLYLPTLYIETGRPMDWGQFHGWPEDRRPLPMTWDQIRTLFATGFVTIGSHTHSHADLSRLSGPKIRGELEASRMIIEERIGIAARHFAYPFGSVSPLAAEIVPEFYRTAVIGGSTKNQASLPEPHAICRMPVSRSDGSWLFRMRLRSLRLSRASRTMEPRRGERLNRSSA